MYLIDTDSISELRKVRAGDGDQRVGAWFRSHPISSVYFSVITIMELRLGVVGHLRKDVPQAMVYQAWLQRVLQEGFAAHVLPIDLAIAMRCGELHVPNRRPFRDALIAATALVHGLTVVTGNERDFRAMGVSLINPWD
jgi:predicted nucleic acid-binding protein